MWYIKADEKSCVIHTGTKFTLERYFNKNGKSAADEFYLDEPEGLRRRIWQVSIMFLCRSNLPIKNTRKDLFVNGEFPQLIWVEEYPYQFTIKIKKTNSAIFQKK